MPFNKGRHDAQTSDYQGARYRLRRGMAKVALRHRYGLHKAVDSYGHPMRAMEMAERHGTDTLERWAHGWGERFQPTKRWCASCKQHGRDPWQPLEHRC